MGFWSGLGRFFGVVAGFAKKAFDIATRAGLTDGITAKAAELVQEAQAAYADNDAKREFVFLGLKAIFPKVSDSILNLAIELAVQAFKARKAE